MQTGESYEPGSPVALYYFEGNMFVKAASVHHPAIIDAEIRIGNSSEVGPK